MIQSLLHRSTPIYGWLRFASSFLLFFTLAAPTFAQSSCSNATNLLSTINLITIEDLTQVQEVDYNSFVGGNLFNINQFGNQMNIGVFPSYATRSVEVAGTVQSGNFINAFYSGAFSPANPIVQNANQFWVNGRGFNVNNYNQGATLVNDNTLAAKKAQIKIDLESASLSLSAATANNTLVIENGNQANFKVNTKNANGIAIFNITDAQLFENSSVGQIEFFNNVNATTIIINVSGTNINWQHGNMVGGWLGSTDGRSKTLWNFYEATAINFQSRNMMGAVLAPKASLETSANVDGATAVKNLSSSAEIHLPFFAGDFSSLCCSISATFSQQCNGGSPNIIRVIGAGAASGQYLVKQGSTTVAGPAANGTIVQLTGSVGVTYTVVDQSDSNCSTTFTTNAITDGCNSELICQDNGFFDSEGLGFTGAQFIGTNGNFNAIIGGNFTTNGVGDTEGRLAVGGNFSNTGAGLFTIGGGNPTGTGGLHAPSGEDNLIVVGNIDGPVGVRGNAVYGGTGTDISFIAGATGLEKTVNNVTSNVLNIASAITYFQNQSNALATCATGTPGVVSSDGFGTVTLDGQNASGLVQFTLPNADANTSYNFINVANASAILINVGGTSATFSNGSTSLQGVVIPTYPINNAPVGELAFVQKTLWNFPNVTSFSLSNYALMGSILAPQAGGTLTNGGINGQAVFGGNIISNDGFEFHNFCYTVDIETSCTLSCDLNFTSVSLGTCESNAYTLTFELSWTDAPTTGNFEVIINESGIPQTITRTNFSTTGTQTVDISVPCNSTIHKIEIRFTGQSSCSAVAVFPVNPIDPLGYIYCAATGEVIPGGMISVTPPPGGNAIVYSNGTDGSYNFFTDGTVGTYTIAYTPPVGYTMTGTPGNRAGDTDDVLDPSPGSQDNPGSANPLILGSGVTNGFLNDPALASNPFFFTIYIETGDPAVENNNIPLICPCAPPSIGTCDAPAIDFTGFTGAGFSANPSPGQLCSDAWVLTGLSDGNGSLGGTHASGDFARGNSNTPGVGTGGVYGINNGGNPALWLQPIGDDLTPGTITTLLCNNSGSTISNLAIGYDILFYNDQGRSSSFNFSYATGVSGMIPGSFTTINSLDFTTPTTATGSPTIQTVPRQTVLNGINLAAGQCIYLRWTTDDVAGSGNRDELGLDNIFVAPAGDCYALGNRVFLDYGGTSPTPSSTDYNNGMLDAGEPGKNGVSVTLYLDPNGDNNLSDAQIIGTNLTANDGYYIFSNLIPTFGIRKYVVSVNASNFTPGGMLAGMASSTTTNSDAITDNNDNGGNTFSATYGITTGGIMLSGVQPAGETDKEPSVLDGGVPNTKSNQTYDFGFYAPVDFGDLLNTSPQAIAFIGNIDLDNNGIPDGTNGAVWAGNIVDAETIQQFSTNADGDDGNNTSTGDDDEDGLTFPAGSPTIVRGQTYNYTIKTNSNSATSITRYWGLWFDWDNDQVFETYYSGSVSGTGNVALVQAVPVPNFAVNDYKTRLVVSGNPVPNTPGATFSNAEVEDYANTTPLPIELIDFNVTLDKENRSILKWRTASEKNNAYFSIQRSLDGQKWQEIAQKKGAGDASTIQTYDHTDAHPLPGTNYYRLQQFDYDGAFSFSPIRVVIMQEKNSAALVYPNPVKDILNIQLNGNPANTAFTLEVFNMLGQQVKTSLSSVTEGVFYRMETGHLTPGTYVLRISDASGTNVQILRFTHQ